MDLFFVISGFIMMYSSTQQCGSDAAREFLIRRFRRIFPLYWIWTTLLLILWKSKLLFTHTVYSPLYIACSCLLWPLANGKTFHPVLDPGWTLTFEIFFYLVFSLAILYGSRIPRGVVVIAGLTCSILVGRLFPQTGALHYLLANALLAEFGFGVVAAYLVKVIASQRTSYISVRWLSGVLIASGVGVLLLRVASGEPQRWRFLVWGFPCFLILLGTVLLQLRSSHSILLYLGDASYSIYLGHFLLIVLYATAVKRHLVPHWVPPDAGILIATAAIIAVSALGYRVIEKPILDVFKRNKRILDWPLL